MNQGERRRFLIQALLDERGEGRFRIPESSTEQKQLLRSLMNVRLPKAADADFLRIQDEYLREEIALRGITDIRDLTPIEEAAAYAQLIRKLNYTQDELAKRIGKSRANIANLLRLLNLPEEVKKLVNEGKLSYGQARALLALEDEDRMIEVANLAVRNQLSVRQLEDLCSDHPRRERKPVDKVRDPFTEDVCNRLQRKYATKVDIDKKKISIYFNDTEDLNRILEIMNVIED